jgi:hypothetical protein
LFRTLVTDQALNLFFLLCGERTTTAFWTPTPARIDAAQASLLEAVDDHAHR